MHRKQASVRYALLLLFLVGCSENNESIRTWRPEDHVQPSSTTRTTASGSTPQEPTSPQSDDSNTSAVEVLFRMQCSSCHGLDGHGVQAAANQLQVPDLTLASTQSQSDEALSQVITNGRGAMPAFGERLTPAGITALVSHIRTLGTSQ